MGPVATWRVARIGVIDISALVDGGDAAARAAVGDRIVTACEDPGVFQVVGHGVDPALRSELMSASREFFALSDEEKEHIAMGVGGSAWRGWFPLGGELTSGRADAKEGIYFGTDLPADDPRVLAGVPLHGPNLYPRHPDILRRLVPEWMAAVTGVGRAVLGGMALGLGLDERWFDRWCDDPTVLFRIFRYPARMGWGVGEHTDYGLLTLLAQDDSGGLEVRTQHDGATSWVAVEPVEGALVCNLGDMLERLSGGRFVATPHRVAAPTADRISMPLFLDPGWGVEVEPLPIGRTTRRSGASRWDGEDVHAFDGPYSAYLLSRIARVFPDLYRSARIDSAQRDGALDG